MPVTQTPLPSPEPPRMLTRWHAAALVAGSMVGVGIFLTPRIVAAAAGEGALYFGVWALGAVVAMAGALSLAELGAMLPKAGGDYVYLREAYGDFAGFLYGWLSLLASFSGAIAAMAVGIPRFQGPVLFGPGVRAVLIDAPLGPVRLTLAADQLLAMALIWTLTALACLRVQVAGRVQLALTSGLLSILLFGACWALLQGASPGSAPSPLPAADLTGVAPSPNVLALLSASGAVYFAYSGWNTATYVAAEIRDPPRDLPWALITATLAVGVLYLVMNAAFVAVLPSVAAAPEAGSATATALFGATGGWAMAAILAVAVTGATLASIIGGSRIPYAMARDGLFFPGIGQLHPRLRTPVRSLLLQAAWASVLVASGTFEDLLRWSTLAIMALALAAVLAVPVLRRRRPLAERPFRTWGYPWTTVVFVVPCASVLVASAIERPGEAVAAAALVGLGWLTFRFGWGTSGTRAAPRP